MRLVQVVLIDHLIEVQLRRPFRYWKEKFGLHPAGRDSTLADFDT